MSYPVPSRAALRALSKLCRNDVAPIRRYGSISRQPSGLISSNSAPAKKLRPPPLAVCQIRSKSTSKEPVDPQLDSSTALPDITNYYTLFPQTIPNGPPQKPSRIPDSNTELTGKQPTSQFYINQRDLRQEFLRLQSVYHPDKYPAGSSAHQRAYALSTLLNNAYKTLSDPLLRAQYVLQLLYDIDVTNEDNSAHKTDPETLMLVMEAQEELESADGEEGEHIVERLREENKARIREAEQELGEAFEASDAQRAKDWSVKLKYWKSLEGGLNEWEPGKEVRLTH